MRKSLFALVGLLVVPSLAFAQGAAGKWMGETQGRGGTQPVVLQLKVDGEHLMGTYQQGEQEAVEIADGKVMDGGNTIMFSRTIAGRGGGDPFVINYTGKVSGSEMTLTREAPAGGGRGGGRGAPMPIMLKKM